MFTREEFENLINNSPLFAIDKEGSPALYKTERYNFLTLLTEYYQTYIYPKKPLEDYSLTLMETAAECIKYYDKDKGEFLHLFNSALKRDLHIAKAKEIVEEKRQGIRLASEDDKLIRKIMALANSKGLDIYNSIVQEKLAKGLNIEIDKLKELIRINDDAIAVASTVTNEDGDEIELYDLQASKEKTAEENMIEESAVISLIEEIEDVFSEVQDRQKRLLSMLLTVEIIKAFNEDVDKVKKLLCNKGIFNQEVFDYYEKNGELPTAKQIGKILGVSEQSLSRTYKNFKEKLKN
jgi:DNA-directed RNA polymerase specialized sigma subunit